jgi:molecular chaperone DnaK
MSAFELFFGIDLGTTNSVAAVFDGARTSVVRNANGSNLTPSVVRVDARGGAVIGAKARRMLDIDPANTCSEFKRLMGTSATFPFPAASKTLSVEELSSLVLKSLRRDFQEQYGYEPSTAVITVPALFEVPQAAATTRAAKLALLRDVVLRARVRVRADA